MSSTCEDCQKQNVDLVAHGKCAACYQRRRRAQQVRRYTPACVEGRRYHSYDDEDHCKLCGSKRVFAN